MTEPKVVLFKELWVLQNTPYPGIPGLKVASYNKTDLNSADAFVSMNINNPASLNNKHRAPVFKGIESTGKPVFVIESPVFRQNINVARYGKAPYHRVGWNHFLNKGKFNNKNSPSDRWEFWEETQKLEVLPWREPNKEGHILIPLQKENDSSLISLRETWGSQNSYLKQIIGDLRKLGFKNKIVVRPHPLYANRTHIESNMLDGTVVLSSNLCSSTTANGGEGLVKDLKDVSFVIGYNSNTLIETIMLGIPTVSIDEEAHSFPMSPRIDRIYFYSSYSIDRTQWLYDLAYTQWTEEEITSGKTWEHLKGIYF